jgi:hypothetical protein
LVRFSRVKDCIGLSDRGGAAIGFLCNVIEGGTIKIENVAGSFFEFQSGYPTGGLVKFVTKLTQKVKFKDAFKDCIADIGIDFIC